MNSASEGLWIANSRADAAPYSFVAKAIVAKKNNSGGEKIILRGK
jgi:hypothetical protein